VRDEPGSVLVAAATGFRAGQVRLDVLLTVLRATVVYFGHAGRPGLLVAELEQGEQWVFVFTSLDALTRHIVSLSQAEHGVEYLSTTGADLVDLCRSKTHRCSSGGPVVLVDEAAE
jgi:hypothetical protein